MDNNNQLINPQYVPYPSSGYYVNQQQSNFDAPPVYPVKAFQNDYHHKKSNTKTRLSILLLMDILIIVLLIASTRVPWSKLTKGYHEIDGYQLHLFYTLEYYPAGIVFFLIIISIVILIIHSIFAIVGIYKKKLNTKSLMVVPIVTFIFGIIILICAFTIVTETPILVESKYYLYAKVTLGGGKDSKTSGGTGIFIVALIFNLLLMILNITFKKQIDKDLCDDHPCEDYRPLVD